MEALWEMATNQHGQGRPEHRSTRQPPLGQGLRGKTGVKTGKLYRDGVRRLKPKVLRFVCAMRDGDFTSISANWISPRHRNCPVVFCGVAGRVPRPLGTALPEPSRHISLPS